MPPKALTRLGLDINYSRNVGRGEIYIPEIGFIPMALDSDGDYTRCYTRDSRLPPGVLTVATGDPALTGQTFYPFIVDSGSLGHMRTSFPRTSVPPSSGPSMPMMRIRGIHGEGHLIVCSGTLPIGLWRD